MSLTADPLLTCPFDRAHQILKSRMQTHLVKCQENHISEEYVTCKFNANHRVKKAEMLHHLSYDCPDQTIVIRSLTKFNMEPPLLTSTYIEPEIPPSEENWDTCSVPAYDPNEKVLNEPILRNLSVKSKAKRRDFHKNERERFNAYVNPTGSSAAAGASSGHDKKETPRRPEIPNNEEVEILQRSLVGRGMGRGIRSPPSSVNRPGVSGLGNNQHN